MGNKTKGRQHKPMSKCPQTNTECAPDMHNEHDREQPIVLAPNHRQGGLKRSLSLGLRAAPIARSPKVWQDSQSKIEDSFVQVQTIIGDTTGKVPADLTADDLCGLTKWIKENAKPMDCGFTQVEEGAYEKLQAECVAVVKWLRTGLQRGKSSREFRDVKSSVQEFVWKVYNVYSNHEDYVHMESCPGCGICS